MALWLTKQLHISLTTCRYFVAKRSIPQTRVCPIPPIVDDTPRRTQAILKSAETDCGPNCDESGAQNKAQT